MSIVFRNEAARQRLVEWSDKFRARIPHPTESRTVATRFGDTHLFVGGPPDAPPIVLLHGALASSAHVLGELAALMQRFRVYAVDVVGQSARSADARPRVDNDDYGQWLREVIDALGLTRTSVIGVSWGGFVAQRLAAIAPERIERLVLLVPAGMVKSPAWAGLVRMGIPMALFRMSPTEARLRKFVKGILSTLDDDWTPYLGEAFQSFNMDMRVPALSKVGEFARLRAPVLVIAADDDVSFPGHVLLARAKELFPTLSDTELLKDCRHSPPTTDAFRAWMSKRIETFLQA